MLARRISKNLDAEVREWEKKTAKAAEAELKSRAAQIASELARRTLEKISARLKCQMRTENSSKRVVDALKPKFKGPIFLVARRMDLSLWWLMSLKR